MSVTQLRSFADLPKVPVRQLLKDGPKLIRPGATNSPLYRLGDRFVVDAPLMPPVMVTSEDGDVRGLFTDPAGGFSVGQMLRRLSPLDVLLGHEKVDGADPAVVLDH